MFRVLLVYPPLDGQIKGPISSEITAISGFPPLHLLYVASHVETIENVEVKIVDCRLDNIDYPLLDRKIREYHPDIVGISVNTFMLLDALKVADLVKRNNPNTKVVFGGIHPTIYPAQTIRFENVDFLVLGEGEFAFRDLVRSIIEGNAPEQIPGIVTKQTMSPESVHPQVIQDLDSLIPPAWHLVNIERYTRERKPVLWLLTSRGCVGRCTFCYIPADERKFRYHSAEYVFNHLLEMMNRYKIYEFYIADDCFTVNKKRVIQFCEMLLASGIKATWGAVSRIDTVSAEVLEIMGRSGCRNIYLGIETGDAEIQRRIRKNLKLDKIREVVSDAQKYGLNPHGYFMIGHPGETEKELKNTIRFMHSLELSGIAGGVAIFQPYPHTTSYLEGLSSGVIKDDYWREFADNPTENFKFRFWNEFFTNEELLSWQRRINNEFYFRPIIVYRTLLEAIRTHRLTSKVASLVTYLKVSVFARESTNSS
jgi:anaerobic magnesium-protoporphyrin IX monomethyl ester cyclase